MIFDMKWFRVLILPSDSHAICYAVTICGNDFCQTALHLAVFRKQLLVAPDMTQICWPVHRNSMHPAENVYVGDRKKSSVMVWLSLSEVDKQRITCNVSCTK